LDPPPNILRGARGRENCFLVARISQHFEVSAVNRNDSRRKWAPQRKHAIFSSLESTSNSAFKPGADLAQSPATPVSALFMAEPKHTIN
jgi:hypothetical protein